MPEKKKWENVRWAIVDDKIVRLVVVKNTEDRYVCKDAEGKDYVISKYDAYKTLREAQIVFDEGLPS